MFCTLAKTVGLHPFHLAAPVGLGRRESASTVERSEIQGGSLAFASLKASQAVLLKLLAGEAKLRETILKVGR
jgi:hypothetical protein